MRDATRGGVATVLNELASDNKIGISIDEHSLPISEEVKGLCEILGFDPLYVANEGKFITVIPEKNGKKVMEILTAHPLGKKASIIGIVTKDNPKKVSLNTAVGGKRIIHTIVGNQLPRIC